ncbi:MAG TPA: hypothetical protein VK540_20625 [Polyangiaceae bacterium]|jgi:hypothetical protein|nr:hypothetical protein [Polyangiaceae bacterium]
MRRRAIVAALSLAGCVDIDPVTVQPVVVDAAPPPDADERTACGMCIYAPSSPGPGCGDQIALCRTDARCTEVIDCTEPLQCYEKPTQIEVNECGLPCFQKVIGNTLPTDLITILLSIATCAQEMCGPICRPE